MYFLAEGVFENKLLRNAFAVEQLSEHPLSEAIVHYVKQKNITAISGENFTAIAGQGVKSKCFRKRN